MEIKWHGHASFEIFSDGKTIYIDPYKLPEKPKKADLVLVTHEHFDHLSNINQLRRPSTIVIGPEGCKKKVKNLKVIEEGEEINLKGFKIEAVPAYNVQRFRSPGNPYHPKGLGVGYVVTVEGKKIYHAGDTDLINEMERLNVDIALLPIGGKYTMDVEEAINAAITINPEIIVPMHYNTVEGTGADPKEFIEGLEGTGIEIKILENKSLKI